MAEGSWLGYLPLAGLAFARCAGALALAPPTGWRHFPLQLRLGAAAVVAMALAATVASPGRPEVVTAGAYIGLVARNLAVGLILGLGLWLLVWGVQVGGSLADQWLREPAEEEEGPLETFFALLAILFFVQLGGPQWLVVFLRQSCDLAPLGAAGALDPAGPWLQWPGTMLLTALRVAAPLVLAMALASAVVGTLDRCLSGLQVAQALPGLRYLVMIVVLVALAPLMGVLLLGELDRWARLTVEAVGALGS